MPRIREEGLRTVPDGRDEVSAVRRSLSIRRPYVWRAAERVRDAAMMAELEEIRAALDRGLEELTGVTGSCRGVTVRGWCTGLPPPGGMGSTQGGYVGRSAGLSTCGDDAWQL